jgi:hypothetical protein
MGGENRDNYDDPQFQCRSLSLDSNSGLADYEMRVINTTSQILTYFGLTFLFCAAVFQFTLQRDSFEVQIALTL